MAALAEELKKTIDSLVSRKKNDDDGFSYVCLGKEGTVSYEGQGRKGAVAHLKTEHEEKFTELRGEQEEKEFDSIVSKLVMNAPFFEEKKAEEVESKKTNGVVVKEPVKKAKKPEVVTKPVVVEEPETEKEYPVTLDIMRMIDARTTSMPNYGSLVGRIARLLAIVISKEGEVESPVLKFKKCPDNLTITQFSEVYPLLEEKHPDFLEHLTTMFPPAKKRLSQFVEKAVTNFEMKVPTVKEVEKLKKAEEDRKREVEKKERAERMKVLKEKREEEEKKRAEARAAMKRKLEEQKLKSKQLAEEMRAKKAKLEAEKPVGVEESVRRKKEVEKIKASLKEGLTGVRRSRLEKRLEELEAKVKKEEKGKWEEQIKKRSESILEILSPKQLRKLCMIYFENLDNLESVSWKDTAAAIKMEDDLEFLMDFFSLLFDMAKFHEQKSFKVGHILVTSKQTEAIIEKGIWSYRDFIKDDSWRIPSSWDVDIPDEELGEDWNRKDDSRLLIGASRFGKNLAKIFNLYPNMKTKAMGDNGKVKDCVKSRFAYMLNVYQNRGRYVEEMGLNLYNVDVEEEENCVQESKPEITEIVDEEEVTEEESMEENGKEEKNGDEVKEVEEVSESILDSKDGEDEEMEEDEEVDEEALLADDS